MPSRPAPRRVSRIGVLLAVIALVAGACSGTTSTTTAPAAATSAGATAAAASSGTSGAAASGGASGGTLTAAFVGPCCVGVDYINPILTGGDQQFMHLIYEHLVTYGIDPTTHSYGPIVPELAASWSTSSDGLTWTFKLQPNVTWQDGTAFTSADVAFSLAICLNPKAGGCNYAGGLTPIVGADAVKAGTATTISGVTTPDPNTVVIQTTKPDAALLDALSVIFIVQQASVSKIPVDQLGKSTYWGTPGQAVGTGPFKISKYVPGQYMELDAYPGYWRGAPKLAHIIRQNFKDPATALLAFDKGQVDLTYLTADEVKREQGNANAVIIGSPSQVSNEVVFNPLANPAFGNVKFRQAMEYAINRAQIIQTLYGGGAQPLSCLFGNAAYHGSENTYAYDPNKAKQLLQQAGINMASLPTFTFDTYYNDPLSLNVMTAIQQDFAAVGLKVTIQQMDSASWVNRFYNQGKSQISFEGAQNGPDGNIAASYFESSSAWPIGNNGWKGYHYSNPQIDQLIQQGVQSFDTSQRNATYKQLCSALADQLPWNFLWQTTRYWIASKKIGNFQFIDAPGGGSFYDAAQDWTINP